MTLLCVMFSPVSAAQSLDCRDALQARAAETMAGAAPQVQRNKGTMGSKDLHLENFSVSNGGQELIEVRCIPPHLLGTSACYVRHQKRQKSTSKEYGILNLLSTSENMCTI